MDREQEEIQFLSFFGVLKESFSIVSTWRKIFTQIALFLILPLSSIYLVHIQVTEILFTKILHNVNMLDFVPEGTKSHNRISDLLASELTAFVLFKIGYFIFFIILSLLSTAAVVYTIACIYTAKELSFRKVMSVVPKVWKRLMVTFICNFLIVLVYIIVSVFAFVLVLVFGILLLGQIKVLGVIFLVGFSVVYVIGLIYISIIWYLASVVSVLEDSYGLNAMTKSQNLIKGKMGITAGLLVLGSLIFFGIDLMFKVLVVFGHGQGIGSRIVLGIVCLVLLSVVMLFSLVAQTIVYFICKSYHHENIDKSSLADHLGGYHGEYVPLKSKDVQLEQYEV